MHQQSFPKLLYILTSAGHNPKLQIMDNEACDILKKTLLKKNIPNQIVTPHIHFQNAAEKSIQTSKEHFNAAI